MHSRIYYLTEDKATAREETNLSEEMFYEGDSYGHFVGSIADYVAMVPEEFIEDDITWSLDKLGSVSNKLESGYEDEIRYIEFKEGYKEDYMKPVLERIKEKVANLKLTDLTDSIGIGFYSLQKEVNDKFGFYYLLEGHGLLTEQDLIRYIDEGKRYYIGQEVIDYHF